MGHLTDQKHNKNDARIIGNLRHSKNNVLETGNMQKQLLPELRLHHHAYAVPAIGHSSNEMRLVQHLYDLQNTTKDVL